MTTNADGRRLPRSSGPDAYGARKVLPAMTGSAFLPAGTCPSCGRPSHPLRTCPQRAAELERANRSRGGS